MKLNPKIAAKRIVSRSLGWLGLSLVYVQEAPKPESTLQLFLESVFRINPEPFFVQIGANDGKTADSLFPFAASLNCRGILVEPNPDAYSQLVRNYASGRGNGKLQFIDTALTKEPQDTLDLHFFEDDPLTAGADRGRLHQSDNVKTITVKAMSVAQFVERFKLQSDTPDILLIDIEGMDSIVLNEFMDCGVFPALIQFEHSQLFPAQAKEIYAKLERHGYRFQQFGIDTIAVKTCLN
jgi:FkbM family methyltransferase